MKPNIAPFVRISSPKYRELEHEQEPLFPLICNEDQSQCSGLYCLDRIDITLSYLSLQFYNTFCYSILLFNTNCN